MPTTKALLFSNYESDKGGCRPQLLEQKALQWTKPRYKRKEDNRTEDGVINLVEKMRGNQLVEIRDCNSSRPASARSAAAVSVGQSSQKELIDAEEGVDQNEEESLPKAQNLKMSENIDYH